MAISLTSEEHGSQCSDGATHMTGILTPVRLLMQEYQDHDGNKKQKQNTNRQHAFKQG